MTRCCKQGFHYPADLKVVKGDTCEFRYEKYSNLYLLQFKNRKYYFENGSNVKYPDINQYFHTVEEYRELQLKKILQ